jgi:DNA-binding Lrp family transcriptional regulator
MAEEDDRERLISSYYGDEAVTALIAMKVDTKDTNDIALHVSRLDEVTDVYVVTGDMDIMARGHFNGYNSLKTFVMEKVESIRGIRDTSTLLVVTKYKEDGQVITQKPDQSE